MSGLGACQVPVAGGMALGRGHNIGLGHRDMALAGAWHWDGAEGHGIGRGMALGWGRAHGIGELGNGDSTYQF